jgi:outer membrane protein OmpA-like peptidoglycan-associated protein
MKTYLSQKKPFPKVIRPHRSAAGPYASSPASRTRAEIRRILRGPGLQVKLTAGAPGDVYEREADLFAANMDQIPLIKNRGQADSVSRSQGGGPLPAGERRYMEERFGEDFSNVRVYTGTAAALVNRAVGAQALTRGNDIFFGEGQYRPGTPGGRQLLAHELTHVVQQKRGAEGSGPVPLPVQGKLQMRGDAAAIREVLDMIGPPAAKDLTWDKATNEVIGQSLDDPVASPSLEQMLDEIMLNETHDAKLDVGSGTAVPLAGRPQPNTQLWQRLDVADVQKIEAASPGSGVAVIAHEIEENFQLAKVVPAPGSKADIDANWKAAHEIAEEAQSDIVEDLVGPGRRVAQATHLDQANNRFFAATDFEHYYIVFMTKAGDVNQAWKVNKIAVSTHIIDGFASGSDAVPASVAADVAAVKAEMANPGNELATLLIEGHTDTNAQASSNQKLSEDRALSVLAELAKNPARVSKSRCHTLGWGETRPAHLPDTGANRPKNRRVEIRITRPDWVMPP